MGSKDRVFVKIFHVRLHSCPDMDTMAKMAKMAKIAILWRFELDAKSGPLETGDFGEIGYFDENRQRACDIQNLENIQTGCQKWPLQII